MSNYDLKLTHRPGYKHSNADALSRRPCTKSCCKAFETGEEKTEQEAIIQQCNSVTRSQTKNLPHSTNKNVIFLEDWEPTKLRDSQLKDEQISPLMLPLLNQNTKPTWNEVSGKSEVVKMLWRQWNRLLLKNQVLYRKSIAEDNDGEVLQIIVPQKLRSEVLQHAHDTLTGGHFGVQRTLQKVKRNYFWPYLEEDVRDYCRKCDKCAAMKLPNRAPKTFMKSYLTEGQNTRVGVDILGPLTRTDRNNRHVLVIADYFTKWATAVPIPDQETTTVAQAIIDEWICIWGTPRILHSDKARNFESELFSEIMRLMGIKKTRTSSLHPQGNGMIERFNRTLIKMLVVHINNQPKTWDEYTKYACMAYNSTIHSTTGFTP